MNAPQTNQYPYLVGGEWRTSAARVEVRSPYNGELAGVTWEGGAADVEAAIQAAAAAFHETRRWPTFRRAAVLEKVLEGLERDRETLARLIVLEAGKPIKLARGEVARALATFTDALEECKRLRGEWLPLDLEAASVGRQAVTRRFPVGPVAAITPYNFPLNLVAHKVAPALACGCTMVLKPAPQAPLAALHLAKLAVEAGVAPGMLNVLLCPVEAAQALVTDERVKMLSFTGSAAVGWTLKQKAGRKRVLLELGGNAGVIVHADADLDHAAQRCAYGGFAYAGQTCISVQRVYAQRQVFAEFLAKFLECVRLLKVGDPLVEATDLGPMISLKEAERIEDWVREAEAQGAQVLCGGQREGRMYPPTVLTGTTPAMKVWSQEVFGPVVIVESYETLAEAMRAVNDSAYGLQAGIFTRGLEAALAAFEELEVGGLMVNEVPTWRADPLPYGGVKASGLGREGVRFALEDMTERKVLVLKSGTER